MKVSIVTIAFNSADTIRATIESVLAQTYSDLEYIIVDGASKDQTMDIVRSYGNRIHQVISERDQGIYDAMNKGVRMATGDVIGVLNSDDFYADEFVIRDVVERMQSEHADACYADLVYVDRLDTQRIVRRWNSGPYEPGQFLRGWMPPHPTFFLKRSKYEEFGVYALNLKSSSDYELMLRMLHRHHVKVAYLPRVITKMRLGGVSNVSWKNRWAANQEDRLAWKMNGLRPHWTTLIRKPLSKLAQFMKR
jgi:glycosyltransferase involved in cell wall biosynthesis